MAKAAVKDKQDKPTFEQAVTELKQIVDKIEGGQIPLEESISQYEKGMALIQHCRTILLQAEKRIEKISAQQVEDDGK
jgi:exodeoxyribonuclease VII small subunit